MKTASLVSAIFLALGVANAEIIPVQVTATVTSLEDNGQNGGYFGGNISLGDTLVMTYSYDTESAGQMITANRMQYEQFPPTSLNISIGSFQFYNDSSFFMSLKNSSSDDYQVASTLIEQSLTDIESIIGVSMLLIDTTGTALSNYNIHIPNFNLAEWDGGSQINISAGRDFQILAQIDSLTVIPEPMTLLLFGFGGLIVSKSRKSKIKWGTK